MSVGGGADGDSPTAAVARPALQIVRGTPTAEELAVVTAVVAAASGEGGDGTSAPLRGRWNDPAAAHRRPWLPGPGAWRAAYG